jgi:choline dehydrogenase-like flavoprotein
MTSKPSTNSSPIDVLVAGAGPTGLLLAGDLAAVGLSVTLVERRPPIPSPASVPPTWSSPRAACTSCCAPAPPSWSPRPDKPPVSPPTSYPPTGPALVALHCWLAPTDI